MALAGSHQARSQSSSLRRPLRRRLAEHVVPPGVLVAEWRDDGCPEATAWLEAKLVLMLRDEQPRDLAV